MRSEGRSCDSGRRLVAAFCLAVLCSVTGTAQEVEDIAAALDRYKGILALASQKLADLDLSEALARFSEVIDGYKAGKLPANNPLTRQIVGGAYEGRARTHANLGRIAEAEADFEALIRFDITWPMDRATTSPKIVALYDKVRQRIVGSLTLQTEPPGAQATLNGEAIGVTPILGRDLTAGAYALRLEAPGFDPLTLQIAVKGGAPLVKSARLTPNARSALVATSPVGAKVSLDGKERGVTFGTGGPEYAEAAARLGIKPEEISAPLLLEHLSPGEHLLKIEKECHEPQVLTVKVSLDPAANHPLRFEPIKLTHSLGSLSLDSSPAGAEALLDGASVGKTPLKLEGICSGRHQVVLRKEGVGQWIGLVEVTKGQRREIAERLRMTLAYLGFVSAAPGETAPPGEQELAAALSSLRNLNLVGPGSGLSEASTARKLTGEGGDLTQAHLSTVASATAADLILWARPSEGGFERKVELTLQPARAALAPVRDRLEISLDDKRQLQELVSRLDATTRLTAPWLGIHAIELHRTTNPMILRVSAGGPAAKAGVREGETVVSLGGKPIASPREMAKVLSGLRDGAQASLALNAAGGQPRQVNVAIGATPIMVPLGSPGLLRARLAAEMEFRSRMEAALGKDGSIERTSALLSLTGLLMKEGLWEAALKEGLEPLSLPEGPGISAGTASFLKGVCFQRLGRTADARKMLGHAASQPEATIGSHDGSPVAERAEQLLLGLPPG